MAERINVTASDLVLCSSQHSRKFRMGNESLRAVRMVFKSVHETLVPCLPITAG
nr:hypothetical protein [Paenibacillus phytorum]